MPASNGGPETYGWRLRELETDMDTKASKEALANVVNDLGQIRADVHAIKAGLEQGTKDRQKEVKEQARERKIDRRWLVGTVLTAVGLLIGAMAILLPALSG